MEIFIFFHNWMNRLLSEEKKVPRTLCGARKVAGSATYKQTENSMLSFKFNNNTNSEICVFPPDYTTMSKGQGEPNVARSSQSHKHNEHNVFWEGVMITHLFISVSDWAADPLQQQKTQKPQTCSSGVTLRTNCNRLVLFPEPRCWMNWEHWAGLLRMEGDRNALLKRD